MSACHDILQTAVSNIPQRATRSAPSPLHVRDPEGPEAEWATKQKMTTPQITCQQALQANVVPTNRRIEFTERDGLVGYPDNGSARGASFGTMRRVTRDVACIVESLTASEDQHAARMTIAVDSASYRCLG